MKLHFTLLALIVIATTAKAQNIVPNSNFALRDTCPNNYSQLSRCTYWHGLTKTTPEYYNSCSSFVGVPNNWAGYEPSSSGAYAGIWNYAGGSNWHEYLAIDIPAMISGAAYKVSVKISLAEKTAQFATEAPGIFFYKATKPDTNSATYLPFTPQVSFDSYGIIYDTSWVLLTETFIADSAFTHLCVGNFKTDAATLKASSGAGNTPIAYYFIDSVAVERIGNAAVHQLSGNSSATLFPNPVCDFAVLSFTNPARGPHSLYIFDINGRVVKKEDGITGETITIDTRALGKGYYYYKLTQSGGNTIYGKMIVQ